MAVAERAVIVAAPDEWLSLPESARRLGKSRHFVLSAALAGRLVARIVAERVVIATASLDAFEAENQVG